MMFAWAKTKEQQVVTEMLNQKEDLETQEKKPHTGGTFSNGYILIAMYQAPLWGLPRWTVER